MSNEQTLQQYNEQLEDNNNSLNNILEIINELPEAGEDIYSTEEQVIGTWIDSKPIYRKLFTGSTETGENLSVVFENDASIDKIINCYGNIQGQSGEQLAFLSDKHALLLNANHTTITYFFNNTDSYSYSYEAVIEYTKTTD